MENNINENEVSPSTPTNNPTPPVQTRLSVPMAIIIAGVLIMIGLLSKGSGVAKVAVAKTLSEQVGVSKEKLAACVKSTDNEALNKRIETSIDKAMSNYADNERGTPYSIVIGTNGIMTDIRGAESYENMKKIIDDALIGKVTTPYKGEVALSEPSDHIKGPSTAKVTIIEYSDFQCPYCKQFQPVVERIVTEYNPNVRWIYRHYPIHQHSFAMLVAADCIAKEKGDDAFFKYGDLLFGLMKSPEDTVSGQL